jgi:MFS family permease
VTTAEAGRRPSWLKRNVVVLSLVSFMQDAASELVYPLLPLLITGVLGAPAAVVGLVESVAEGFAALTKYISGRVSDRTGRKPLVATGYGMAAVGKVIVASAAIWPVVLVGRSVDRIGKGVRGAPRDALLAEGVAPTNLGRVYGFHRAADTMGAVVGPLIGLIALAATNGDIRAALWWAVPPAIISVLLVGLTKEKPRAKVEPEGAAEATTEDITAATPVASDAATAAPQTRATVGPLPDGFRRVVIVLGLIAVVNFPDALVLLRVNELGFGATGVVAAYVVYNLSYALVSLPAGRLSDSWRRSQVYALGLTCFAIGYIGLGLADGGWMVFALMVIYGGFNGCTDGVGKAWISSLVPAADRGRAQGIFQGVSGGAVLVAGLWAGLLWQVGPGDGVIPLIAAGAVAGVAAVVLVVRSRQLG